MARASATPGTTPVQGYSGQALLKRIRIYQPNTGAIAGVLKIWDRATSPRLAVSGVTNAAPFVVTVPSGHGIAVEDIVAIDGVGGATGANGVWRVTATTSTTITIGGTAAPGAYTSGGFVTVQPVLVLPFGAGSTTRGTISAMYVFKEDLGGLYVANGFWFSVTQYRGRQDLGLTGGTEPRVNIDFNPLT